MKHFPILGFILVTQLSTAQVGNPAPDFTVTDVHGQQHHLYEYLEAGKVVILDFFYTTCGPCQYYSPQVNLAYEKYGCNTATTIFIAIDYGDTEAMVEAYDQEYQIEFPSVSGVDGGGDGVVADYGVFAFPTFYVIDSTKKIIDEIDPPTLQVFDYRFGLLGIEPADCEASGLAEIGVQGNLRIFPNPADGGQVAVEWPFFESEEGLLEIMDLNGRVVYRQSLSGGRGAFSTETFNPGIFLVRIISLKQGDFALGRLVVR